MSVACFLSHTFKYMRAEGIRRGSLRLHHQNDPDRVSSKGRETYEKITRSVWGDHVYNAICTYCHDGEVTTLGGQISYHGHENRH